MILNNFSVNLVSFHHTLFTYSKPQNVHYIKEKFITFIWKLVKGVRTFVYSIYYYIRQIFLFETSPNTCTLPTPVAFSQGRHQMFMCFVPETTRSITAAVLNGVYFIHITVPCHASIISTYSNTPVLLLCGGQGNMVLTGICKIRIYWSGISHLESLLTLFLPSPMCIPSHCFPLKFYWHLYFWMKTKFNECELEYHNQYIDNAVGWTYEPGHGTDHSSYLLSRLRMSGSTPTCPMCLHLVHRDNIASPCLIF